MFSIIFDQFFSSSSSSGGHPNSKTQYTTRSAWLGTSATLSDSLRTIYVVILCFTSAKTLHCSTAGSSTNGLGRGWRFKPSGSFIFRGIAWRLQDGRHRLRFLVIIDFDEHQEVSTELCTVSRKSLQNSVQYPASLYRICTVSRKSPQNSVQYPAISDNPWCSWLPGIYWTNCVLYNCTEMLYNPTCVLVLITTVH